MLRLPMPEIFRESFLSSKPLTENRKRGKKLAEEQHFIYDDVSHRLAELIEKRQSFVLRGLNNRMSDVIADLERIIEQDKMTCRVYSRNRAFVVAATSFVPFLGWANLAAVAAHNIATYDPDYEIGKDVKDKRLHVTYKR